MKRLSDQTLYEILEVPVDAPPEDVERAYERARALYGPGSLATYSLVTPDEAQLLNNRIEEAKAVLLDPDARVRYDERIGVRPRAAPPPAAPPPAATPWPPPQAPAPPPGPAQPEPTGEPAAPADPPVGPAAAEPPAGPAPIALDAPISTPPPGALAAEVLPAEPPAPVGTPASPGAAALTASPVTAGPVPLAPIPLKNEVPAPRELLVPEGAAWTGEMLRQAREARGLTLPQLSERTKVTRHHLENIEGERFGKLPAPVYLRGILMSLARELRLDGQKVARSYLDRQAAALAEPPRK